MKILHIVQSLDPEWGGIARVLPELAGVLAAAGDECRIATLAGGRFGTPPTIEGVEVLAFAAKEGNWFARSAEFDRRVDELAAWADVVHLHGLWTGQNWMAGKAARRVGKPYIMTPHSMMMPWAWNRSWWKKRPAGWLFEHGNLRKAAAIHALAAGEAEAIRALGFNSNVETIPNGLHVAAYERKPSVDRLCAKFPELNGKRWILFLGRIHPQKGIVQAMQAGFDVLSAAKQWHLIVAGPDEVGMRSVLEAAVRRKGAADRVTFTGMLDRDEVLAVLGGAEVLLQPSMSEGLSMSILEAMASGIAVVISPACNLPAMEERGAGVIVESQRRVIAGALGKLLALSREELQAMGGRGRELAREQFDWSVLTPRYRAMYSRVAGR